jgi:hypothetical protein
MARKNDDLFTTLRKRGLRKSVAQALADAQGNGRKGAGRAEGVARDVLKDLRAAGDTIRERVLDGDAKTRSEAAKKAARTRKRNASKRSAAAKKGAATRARARSKSR